MVRGEPDRQELIIALRDIAGLAWGGCDLGLDSGDMMHWDLRSVDIGKDIRSRAHRYKGAKL